MRESRFIAPALAAGILFFAGCGNVHENDPRPPIPTTISVSVNHDQIDVSPDAAGEPGERGPYLNQNRNAPVNQADRKAPLVTRFAVANLTQQNTRLTLNGPVKRTVPVVASGSADFTVALPTGIYRLTSPASSSATRLTVADSRISSGGDVLIP